MKFTRTSIEAALNEAFKANEPLTEINEAAPKMRKDFYVEKLREIREELERLENAMEAADSSRYSHVKKDFNKALKVLTDLTSTLIRKGATIPE